MLCPSCHRGQMGRTWHRLSAPIVPGIVALAPILRRSGSRIRPALSSGKDLSRRKAAPASVSYSYPCWRQTRSPNRDATPGGVNRVLFCLVPSFAARRVTPGRYMDGTSVFDQTHNPGETNWSISYWLLPAVSPPCSNDLLFVRSAAIIKMGVRSCARKRSAHSHSHRR